MNNFEKIYHIIEQYTILTIESENIILTTSIDTIICKYIVITSDVGGFTISKNSYNIDFEGSYIRNLIDMYLLNIVQTELRNRKINEFLS